MSTLPQVGVQAVILGLLPFLNGAKSMESAVSSAGRSMFLFERVTHGSGRGISDAFNQASAASANLAAANARMATVGVDAFTQIRQAALLTAQVQINAARTTYDAEIANITRAEQRRVAAARTRQANELAILRATASADRATAKAAAPGPTNAPIRAAATADINRQLAIDAAATNARARASVGRARTDANALTTIARTTANTQVAAARQAATQIVSIESQRERARIAIMEAEAAAAEANAARIAAVQKAAIGTGVAIAAAGAVVTGIATVSAAKYEEELVNVAAVGELTAAGQEKLSQKIKEVGKTSTVSQNDLAKGAAELIKAGVGFDTVINSALQAVNDMKIASHGELDMADASTLVVIGLNAFAKSGATVADVVDSTTGAVQRSSLTFTEYADALRQGGNVAATAGLTIQEFAAAVGTAGLTIKSGSEIGTNLRQMFLKLQDPSAKNIKLMREYGISLFDAQGKQRPFRDILIDLNHQFSDDAIAAGKLTEAQRAQALASIFGGRAVKVITALLNEGVGGYDDMLASVNRLKASDLAAKQLESTAAKFGIFSSNVVIAANDIGELLLPGLRDLLEWLTKVAQGFPTEEIKDFIFRVDAMATVTIPGIIEALKNLVTQSTYVKGAIIGIGTAITISLIPALVRAAIVTGTTLIPAIGRAIVALGTFAVSTLLAAGPWAILAALIAASAILIMTHAEQLGRTIAIVFDAIQQIVNIGLNAVLKFMDDFRGQLAQAWDSAWNSLVSTTVNAIGPLVESVIPGGLNAIGQFFTDFATSVAGVWGKLWNGIIRTAANAVATILDALAAFEELDIGGQRFEANAKRLRDMAAAVREVDTAGKVVTLVGHKFDALGTTIQTTVSNVRHALEPAASSIGDFFDAVGTQVRSTIAGAQHELDSFLNQVNDLFASAPIRPRSLTGGPDTTAPPRGPAVDVQPGTEGVVPPDPAQVEKQKRKIEELFSDLTRTLESIARKTLERVFAIGEETGRKINEAIIAADKKIKDAQKNAEEALTQMDTQRQIEDNASARKDALDEALNQEALMRERAFSDTERFRQRNVDAEERAFSAVLDAQKKALDQRHQNELDALQKSQEIQLHDAQVARDFFELQRQQKLDLISLEQDYQDQINKIQADALKERNSLISDENRRHIVALGNATTDAQRQAEINRHASRVSAIGGSGQDQIDAIQTEFQQRKAKLLQQQQDDRDEFFRQQRMAADEADFRAQLDAQQAELKRKQDAETAALQSAQDERVLQRRLALDDLEFAYRRNKDDEDIAFRDRQDATRRALQRQLDDEEFARRQDAIVAERDAKIDAANQELTAQTDKIRAAQGEALAALQTTVADQLAAVQNKFNDQVPDLIDTVDQSLIPLIEGLAQAFSDNFAAVQDAAFQAAAAIATAIQAYDAFQNAVQNGPSVPTGDIPQFAEGGIVPGPIGKPMLAVVHGGEAFAGVHGQRASLIPHFAAAARAASSSTTISHTTTYDVKANYGRVQNERSLLMDLRALAALRR